MADRNNAPHSSRLFSSVNPETRQSSRSMKEQTVKLIDMAAKYVMKREDKCKLEILVFHLKSQRLRNSANSATFYRNGGVDSLLQLSRSLQKNVEEDSSLLSLVWGTLANVCALDKRTHQKVSCHGDNIMVWVGCCQMEYTCAYRACALCIAEWS